MKTSVETTSRDETRKHHQLTIHVRIYVVRRLRQWMIPNVPSATIAPRLSQQAQTLGEKLPLGATLNQVELRLSLQNFRNLYGQIRSRRGQFLTEGLRRFGTNFYVFPKYRHSTITIIFNGIY